MIWKSFSAYSSRIVLIKKKNSETRMCIDNLNELRNIKYFTAIDIKNDFFHIWNFRRIQKKTLERVFKNIVDNKMELNISKCTMYFSKRTTGNWISISYFLRKDVIYICKGFILWFSLNSLTLTLIIKKDILVDGFCFSKIITILLNVGRENECNTLSPLTGESIYRT